MWHRTHTAAVHIPQPCHIRSLLCSTHRWVHARCSRAIDSRGPKRRAPALRRTLAGRGRLNARAPKYGLRKSQRAVTRCPTAALARSMAHWRSKRSTAANRRAPSLRRARPIASRTVKGAVERSQSRIDENRDAESAICRKTDPAKHGANPNALHHNEVEVEVPRHEQSGQ